MSTQATREFLPALRELGRRLSVPIPDRVRILRELEFDLEQLHSRFIATGLSSEEARTRALEALVPGGVALRQLDDLHAPVYRRLTRRIRDDRLRLLERTALAVATMGLVVVEGVILARGGTFRVPAHLLWPVLTAGALVFAAIVDNAFRIWVKGDQRPRLFGIGTLLALSGAALAVGLICSFIDTYHVLAALEHAPELASVAVPRWLQRNAALLSLSILFALAGALAWFAMTQWRTAVSAAYRDVLGIGSSNPFDGV